MFRRSLSLCAVFILATGIGLHASPSAGWATRTPMGFARSALGVASLGGKIYAVGGWNNGVLSTLEIYDPSLNSWTTGAPMPTARSGLGFVALNGLLYAIGGELNGAT